MERIILVNKLRSSHELPTDYAGSANMRCVPWALDIRELISSCSCLEDYHYILVVSCYISTGVLESPSLPPLSFFIITNNTIIAHKL